MDAPQTSKPKPLLRRIVKVLFVTFSSAAILLAVALGVFRLLIGQIPEYQAELKAWVADELGLIVDFDELDARLGLAGPELTFRVASLRGRDGLGFAEAERVTLTLDAFALINREVDVSRLTLDGVGLTVERDADGGLRIGDYSLAPTGGTVIGSVPAEVEVVVNDGRLRYIDDVGNAWQFDDLEIEMQSDGTRLEVFASMRPPERLGNRIGLDIDAAAVGPEAAVQAIDWRLAATGQAIDIGALAALVPSAGFSIGGAGDVEVSLSGRGRAVAAANVSVALGDVVVGTGHAPYDRLHLAAGWQRDNGDWRLQVEDVELSRDGREWPGDSRLDLAVAYGDDGVRAVRLATSFLRVDDLRPLVEQFPETQLAEQWALFEPRGDVSDVDFSLERLDDDWNYSLDMQIDGLAVQQVAETPGVDGISGHVRANSGSGTIDFASGPFEIDWPGLFPRTLSLGALSGAVGWQQGRDVVRIFSADLGLGVLDGQVRSSFDFSVPQDGSSPTIDLEATLDAVSLEPAKAFLPTAIMPASVVDWVERAVVGGRATNAELSFVGPVRSFPFDDGSGRFRVAADVGDVTLDYMRGWPAGEELAGRIEFVNAGFSARASGRALTNRFRNGCCGHCRDTAGFGSMSPSTN